MPTSAAPLTTAERQAILALNHVALRRVLVEKFSLSELDRLCDDLSIDPESIAGKTKEDKAAELVKYMDRRDTLAQLPFAIHAARPGLGLNPTSQPATDPIATTRLPRGAGVAGLVGREAELKMLDEAWRDPGTRVLTWVAWGGTGKTALLAHWARQPEALDGLTHYFDWSFYSQGARSEGDPGAATSAASGEYFVREALRFFGDEALAESNAGARQKGERLAALVRQHKTLLVLDGVEPLQDAKTGELRDQALQTLLRGLAMQGHDGLCVITTRLHIPDLDTWQASSAPQHTLDCLSVQAGAKLLDELGVQGTPAEREGLAADVKGHALTLTLLGKYLKAAHGGDIRRRDEVDLREADDEETCGHAWRVLASYTRWLERDKRTVELAILRLLGLFNRPVTPDCLDALRAAPAIDGLTDALVNLTDAQWNVAVGRLVGLGLLETQPWRPRRVLGYDEDTAKKEMAAAKHNQHTNLGDP